MRQKFGQHFLRSPEVVKNIIDAIAPRREESFIEIGPGDGALTDALVECGASVVGVEIDNNLAARLVERYAGKQDNVKIINTDILSCDWSELLSDGVRLVGNLPYNISAPLILRIAESATLWRDCHIMVQKEVGQRLCAPPGGGDYGRLTVRGRWSFLATWLFEVPPEAFSPPPKVDSAVLRLLPKPSTPPPLADILLRAAFGQRRKTLKNALSEYPINWDEAGIDPQRRAQTLSPEDFLTLVAHCKQRPTAAQPQSVAAKQRTAKPQTTSSGDKITE